MNKMRGLILFLLFLTACSTPEKNKTSLLSTNPEVRVVTVSAREKVEAKGKKWMISTQGNYSTEIAHQVLKSGGNLVDAAIAASFAIGVERPQSTGIGGGGFLIYHEAKTGKNYVLDFRERAPRLAAQGMFLNPDGSVNASRSVTGALSVAVPGLVRGLLRAHQKWGKLPWKRLVSPSIKLARNGFPVYPSLRLAMEEEAGNLALFEESKKTFFVHSFLKQEALAKTLEELSINPESFYRGKIAKKIIKSIEAHQGIMVHSDLENYQVKEREALQANWKGYQIISMPPPSSGGIHVIQILKLLENQPLAEMGFLTAESINLIAQAMQQAFADRAQFLGDPDFVKVPVKTLISDAYLNHLSLQLVKGKARFQKDVHAGSVKEESFETSHLSLMDQEGNVVVSTQTINGHFGSALTVEGTGIVLNNEMDDFSAQVGAQNIFGATSTSLANSVEPHKTPLSSMSPTIILKNGVPILALGAPGGTRIITAVAQTILNHLVYQKDLYQSVSSPRFHEQWSPDVLKIENQSFDLKTLTSLDAMGWKVVRTPTESNVMAVSRDLTGLLTGVSDPRDIGTSKGE